MPTGRLSSWHGGPDGAVQTSPTLRGRYLPGAETGQAMLGHNPEDGGIVMNGRLELSVGKQQRVLGPGNAYYCDSRVPHRFGNVSDDECEVVSACTPPSF